jgi:RimJ/RimL family protein N-acetyltransferase
MIYRPASEFDLDRLVPLMTCDPFDMLAPDIYRKRRENREYRPEWTWIAQENADTAPIAAAVWWGRPAELLPAALDGVFVAASVGPEERVSLAAGLLNAAHRAFAKAPDYHIFLPPDWHDRPATTEAVAWRSAAAGQAGLTSRLERLRYEWTTRAGLPVLSGRLRFRPEPDDDLFADLMSRVLAGTLDATSSRRVALVGARAQAEEDLRFYRDTMLGERSWWRVAETPDGQLAGFGLPSRNAEYPVVGYLGVLPEYRGRGYVDEILADVTRTLVARAGATTVHADTDLGNRPMAASFGRAGYQVIGRRLVLSAP